MERERLAKALLLACTLFATAAVLAPAARAQGDAFAISAFTLTPTQTEQVSEAGEGGGAPRTRLVQEPYSFDQAGGHPDALTATIAFSSEARGQEAVPTRDPRDVVIDLPPGLTANPNVARPCPRRIALEGQGRCPSASQVGVYTMRLKGDLEWLGPIVEVSPEAGEIGELAYVSPIKAGLPLAGRLTRTADGYGFALIAPTLPGLQIVSVQTTLWGTPALQAHDAERGLLCHGEAAAAVLSCEGGGEGATLEAAPFVTMPSDCAAGALSASAYADSWEQPASWTTASASLPAPTGCASLAFSPTLEASVDTPIADEPVAMTVKVDDSQGESLEAAAAVPLHEASVTLPPGVTLNPAFAAGVQACAAGGPEGIDIPASVGAAGQPLLPDEAGEGEELGPEGLKLLAPGRCPAASRIGLLEARTPLLDGALTGSLYLGEPLCGDEGQAACTVADAADGAMLPLYLELGGVAEDGTTPGAGTETTGGDSAGSGAASASAADFAVKLEGRVLVDPADGQLTVKLEQAPQLPLEDLVISLNGGPRALLANPASCGAATTTSELTPWSAPGVTPEGLLVPGTPDASPTSSYEVSGCEAAARFAPGFIAGTLTALAGASSPLTLSVTRNDREPYLRALQVKLPAGLSAKLSGVPLCGEPAASAGSCGEASRIGEAVLEAGAGSDLLQLRGEVYLTGPYGGGDGACSPGQAGCAPFGLSIVVDASAGPLNLGTLVVRARVDIDPRTAALTITSDPLPMMLLGVPLRLRRISLEIDRPGFILNPTSCGALSIAGAVEGISASASASASGAGTVAGAGGAPAAGDAGGSASSAASGSGSAASLASVSEPFAAAACKRLRFTPKLRARTQGNGHFAGHGASLTLTLTMPSSSTAEPQANLHSLALALPKRLPARLETIEHACTSEVFERNPAACPKASLIGLARVGTPLLTTPLTGPAYLVASGGSGSVSASGGLAGETMTGGGDGASTTGSGAGGSTRGALPEIILVLQSQGVSIDLSGSLTIDARNVTIATFHSIPDIPIRRLRLDLPEGRHSILSAGGSLCRRPLRMKGAIAAQNGARRRAVVRVRVSGCGRRGRARSARARGHRGGAHSKHRRDRRARRVALALDRAMRPKSCVGLAAMFSWTLSAWPYASVRPLGELVDTHASIGDRSRAGLIGCHRIRT